MIKTGVGAPLVRVLVVEDEEDIKELVKTVLTSNGFEVYTSPGGEAGLVAATRLMPDLIILDVVMPSLSGLEVCRLLKGRRFTGRIPVLVMSVLSREVDRKYVYEAGADGYLVKPFSSSQLLSAVDGILMAPA